MDPTWYSYFLTNLTSRAGHFTLGTTLTGRQRISITGYASVFIGIGCPHVAHFLAYIQATNNLEWYDPEAVTTEGGALVVTLSRKATHDLNYQGGEHIFLVCCTPHDSHLHPGLISSWFEQSPGF